MGKEVRPGLLGGITESAKTALPHNWKDYCWQFGVPVLAGVLLVFLGKGEIVLQLSLYYWPIVVAFVMIVLTRFIWALLSRSDLHLIERTLVISLFVVVAVGCTVFGRYGTNSHSPSEVEIAKGESMGQYPVKIGKTVTVSAEEFRITFVPEVYTKISKDGKVVDSELVFPEFKFWYPSILGRLGEPQPNFRVDQQYSLSAKYYYYTARLIKLNHTSADSSAVFEVYRKELPPARGPLIP